MPHKREGNFILGYRSSVGLEKSLGEQEGKRSLHGRKGERIPGISFIQKGQGLVEEKGGVLSTLRGGPFRRWQKGMVTDLVPNFKKLFLLPGDVSSDGEERGYGRKKKNA